MEPQVYYGILLIGQQVMLLPRFDEGDVAHAHLVFHTLHDQFGPPLQADEHLLAVLVEMTAFGVAILARIVEVQATVVELRAPHDSRQKVVAASVLEIKEVVFLH